MKIIGVDLGIRKVAYSVWDDDLLTETAAYESNAGTRQGELMDCADELYSVVRDYKPDFVVIEETLLGNNVKYSIKLAQMMGACLVRMAELEQDVISVNVSQWKKAVLGNGNAGKDAVREYISGVDNAYSDLCGWDQDRFDAACIGYYGIHLHRLSLEVFGGTRPGVRS